MIFFEGCIIWLVILNLAILCSFQFIRRVSRSFRRVSRRAVRRITRSFRRVNRKVQRVHRRIAKTDPHIFKSINTASEKYMGEAFDKRDKEWIKEKNVKNEVKNKVAIEIERQIQESPMREMRPLVDKTIEATIDLAFLEELKKRGDQVRIVSASTIGKIFWRLIVPLATAGVIGGATYIYPDKIPPGSLIIPEWQQPPPGGNPPPIDPIEIAQSTVINAAVYGIGTLILIGLIIYIRRR